MTCSKITSHSLPTEIDADGVFHAEIHLEEGFNPSHVTSCPAPDPNKIFTGIADVSIAANQYYGWITNTTDGIISPGVGWTLVIDDYPNLKSFWKMLTGLDELPDMLHWRIATGPVAPTGGFTSTDITPVYDIPVIKANGNGNGIKLPWAWIALGTAAVGVSVVGVVGYKKWGGKPGYPGPYR